MDFFPRFSLSDADVAARVAAEAVSCPAFLACLVDLFCVESEPLVKQLKEDEMKDFMLVMFFPRVTNEVVSSFNVKPLLPFFL